MSSTITFEAIYDLVRKEKTNDELQKLESNSYEEIVNYLKLKINIYKSSKNNISSSELEKIKSQINSARKLVKELYERRERKIVQLAIDKSRTKFEENSNLLKHEKKMLDKVAEELSIFRKDILLKLINAQNPNGKSVLENTMIRFISPVPKFLGKNLEIFGPFEEGDIANLPKEIATILIDRERAEKVQPN